MDSYSTGGKLNPIHDCDEDMVITDKHSNVNDSKDGTQFYIFSVVYRDTFILEN